MEDTMIDTRGGRFGVRLSGAAEAPLVILLHGFPDDASTFDTLASDLTAAGYRVAAPYLRGYAPSPLNGPLTLDALVDDLLAMSEALSPDRPVGLVGHDYGAQIGYMAMTKAPARFFAAVTLAGAHPAVINHNIKRLPRQWWMSRYIIFFQFGHIADRAVARDDFAYVDRLWRRWSPGFLPPPEHLARVKSTLQASMPMPIDMYREGGFAVPAELVHVPTLFIAGQDDGCLLPALADGQEALFPDGYDCRIWPGVGHFPHLENPGRTSDAVASWLQRRG